MRNATDKDPSIYILLIILLKIFLKICGAEGFILAIRLKRVLLKTSVPFNRSV